MTRLKFDQLVEQLEQRFGGKEEKLTKSALRWAILGYSVLVLGMIVSFGIIGTCSWLIYKWPSGATIKIGAVLIIGAVLMGKSIVKGVWVRTRAPEGRELTEKEAPQLFQLIHSISARAGGIRLHKVLLTSDLNASVVQAPRFGIFGGYQNYLYLGIQLMDALSTDEFHAVLAHEFAHLSHAHGRMGTWIYRIRRTWENVATAFSNQGGVMVLPVTGFLSWFWPRFNARAFVLSRQQEYQADAFSAAVISPAIVCQALTRVELENQRIDQDFWGKLDRRSETEKAPPQNIFQELADFLKSPIDPSTKARWMAEQLARLTDTSDTHPALKDRIAAVAPQDDPPVLEPIVRNSSDELLGQSLAESIRENYSRMWLDAHATQWQKTHESRHQLKAALADLDEDVSGLEAHWKKLCLRINLEGTSGVAAELAAFTNLHPEHHESRYLLGGHLLTQNKPEGLALLEQVIKARPQHTIECLGLMANYHGRTGNATAIRDVKQRADEFEHRLQQAINERSCNLARDPFEAPPFSTEQFAAMRETLAQFPQLQEARIAKRITRFMPEWNSYVMVVRLKFPIFSFITQRHIASVVQTIANAVDVDGYLIVVQDRDTESQKKLAKKIRSMPGTSVFSRKKS